MKYSLLAATCLVAYANGQAATAYPPAGYTYQ